MKIYTHTGDGGKTTLFSGERVAKDHDRISACGELDELNAVIGMLAASLGPGAGSTGEQLRRIQSDLLQAGAWLASTPGAAPRERLAPITAASCRRLESLIDAMAGDLPELRAFILPGGHPQAAWAHVARTVCRRVERAVVHVAGMPGRSDGEWDDLAPIIALLNRLSDYFFMLARHLNQRAGVADILWQP